MFINLMSFVVMAFLGMFTATMSGYKSIPRLLQVADSFRLLFYISFVACVGIYFWNFGLYPDSLYKVLFYLSLFLIITINLIALRQRNNYYEYAQNLSRIKKLTIYTLPNSVVIFFLFCYMVYPAVTIQ